MIYPNEIDILIKFLNEKKIINADEFYEYYNQETEDINNDD